MTNIAMVKPWPIEIDDLPFLNMVISMAMLNNQRVVGFNGIYDNRFVGRLSKGFSSRS
jgi:hypothetical protein